MLCFRTLTSSYLSRLFVSSHSIIIYHFLSQMAGDKRKGKAVAEPKKKKTKQQKEWERVLAVPYTQGQHQRGIRISEDTRSQGKQPQGEQQQQQPRRSGRGHQTTEQSETPPSLARSRPRTRGGHTQPQPTPRQRRTAAEELTERERAAGSRPPAPQRSTSRGFRSLSP
jgi:DNA primase